MPDRIGTLANVEAWLARVGVRPAVVKGMAVPKA